MKKQAEDWILMADNDLCAAEIGRENMEITVDKEASFNKSFNRALVALVIPIALQNLISAAGILTAQYWGKKDFAAIRRVLNISRVFRCLGTSAKVASAMLPL
jgi:Na+-driven multidrug efflux pump